MSVMNGFKHSKSEIKAISNKLSLGRQRKKCKSLHKYGVLALAQTVLDKNRRKSKSINLVRLAKEIKAKDCNGSGG